jgi:hypothetical protein
MVFCLFLFSGVLSWKPDVKIREAHAVLLYFVFWSLVLKCIYIIHLRTLHIQSQVLEEENQKKKNTLVLELIRSNSSPRNNRKKGFEGSRG